MNLTPTTESPIERVPAPKPTDEKAPRSANGWGYRPQLDGLRSLAVYLVVAFHAGSWRLQGGFIGVDLFFVLSGFLVTNVILTDLAEEGHLRLRRFYARRVRRLIPAAALAVVGTSVLALLVSSQLDRSSWAADATASSLWYANWHFIAEANNYFASDDATSPFQHFWSLSIEEQFYLAFPALLTVLWVVLRRSIVAIAGVVGVLLAAGLALQLYWAGRDPNRAYLGTDTRAYQLLVGVLLALVIWRWPIPRLLQRTAGWMAAGSVALLVFVSSAWLDVDASNRGVVAAAAAALCVASVQTASGGVVVRVLSWTPVRYLGQISYGTYLWHWPIVVLTLQVVDISPLALFIVSATFGTALAALSHELVERPVRGSSSLNPVPRAVIAGGVVLAVVSGLLLAPALLDAERKPAIEPNASPSGAVSSGNPEAVPTAIDWVAATLAPPDAPSCELPGADDCIVHSGGRGTMLLIGDSHARMFLPTFQYIAEQHDLTLALAYSTSCPWMAQAIPRGNTVGKERCIEVRQQLYDKQLEALDPDVVVLAGYPYSIFPEGLESTDPAYAGVPQQDIIETLVRDSISRLLDNARRLVFIEPIPTFDRDPLSCLSAASFVDECAFAPLVSTVEERLYRDADAGSDRITSLDLDHFGCPLVTVCDPVQLDYPVWRDSNHFTARFAELIAPRVDDYLRETDALGVLARQED